MLLTELMRILCVMVILKGNFIDFRYKAITSFKRAICWGVGMMPSQLLVQDLSASFKDFLFEMSKLKRETKITLTDPRRKLYYLRMSNWKMEHVFFADFPAS